MPGYANDLEDVRALEACWERLCSTAHKASEDEFRQLVEKWGEWRQLDPISLPTDLLSPLGQEFREITHTQLLAHFFNPRAAHQLGAEPLHALLDCLYNILKEEHASEAAVLETLEGVDTARVEAERAVRIQSGVGNENPRTDLWIEIPASVPKVLIVIENKIGDQARLNQLKQYEQAIEKRLEQLGRKSIQPLVFRVYLTLEGEPPPQNSGEKQWFLTSYLVLGHLLMPVLSGERSPGREMLRLYLATIFQKLYGLKWTDHPSAVRRGDLVHYLRTSLENR